jgi:drug/metabolite transporter (DMT)-like permease
MLIFLTLVWGGSFPMVRWSVARIDAIAFTGLEFFFGALALAPLCFLKPAPLPCSRRREPPGPRFWLKAGAAAGFLLACGSILQYQGMVWTTSGKSAFISSLYVILVPLMAIVMGRVPGRAVWAGLAAGVAGLFLLSGVADSVGDFNRGDALTLAGDACWASHLILVGRCANRVEPIRFVTVQAALAGSSCLAIAAARGAMPGWSAFLETLPFTLFGIVSVSLAYLIQTYCQREMRASETALVLQLKAVFAALFGMAFLGETMTPAMWGGAALVICGSLLAQTRADRLGRPLTAQVPENVESV